MHLAGHQSILTLISQPRLENQVADEAVDSEDDEDANKPPTGGLVDLSLNSEAERYLDVM